MRRLRQLILRFGGLFNKRRKKPVLDPNQNRLEAIMKTGHKKGLIKHLLFSNRFTN
jgi:hypothetical protein